MRFLIFLLIFSCAQGPKIEDIDSVELSPSNSNKIIIDNSLSVEDKSIVSEKSPVICLTVYSSLYHSLGSIKLLKSFERNSIDIQYLSSQGFGALIFALYAKYESSSQLEWIMFKLFKKLGGDKAYSLSWYKTINDFIDSEFKSMKFRDLNRKLVIPFIVEETKLSLVDSGKVSEVLKKAINIEHAEHFYLRPYRYHSVLGRYSPNLNLSVAFMPKFPNVSQVNGYSYGLLTKHLGVIMGEEENISLLRPMKNLAIDKFPVVSEILSLYDEQIDVYINDVKKKLEELKNQDDSKFSY